MVQNKKPGDIVYYLKYTTHVIQECKVVKVNNDESYNLLTASGVDLRHVKDWHLYNTRQEAEKQAVYSVERQI